MDADDGAEEVVEDVDVVDEVDGDDAAACGWVGAPGGSVFGGEVGGRFEEGPEAVDGDDVAEGAGGEDLLGFDHVGVEASVVADVELEVGVLGLVEEGEELAGCGGVVAEGLLDEDVDVGEEELLGDGDVGVVGGADYGGVGLGDGLQGGFYCWVVACAELLGGGCGAGEGVDEGDEVGGGVGEDGLGVTGSDEACAYDDEFEGHIWFIFEV